MFQNLQRQSQAHKHVTTAHIAQTMSLLHLSTDELRESVERELASNPALEMVDTPRCPACGKPVVKPGACPLCANRGEAGVIVFTSPARDFEPGRGGERSDPYSDDDAPEPAERLSLAVVLLRQIAPDLPAEDRPIAAHLLTGLDEDGLLTVSPAEIAAYFHIPKQRVETVREMIQRAEPLGCGSCTSQEALQIQLSALAENGQIPVGAQACLEHFELLAAPNSVRLAELTGLGNDEIEAAIRFISANLNPYPARANWGNPTPPDSPTPVYRSPDILLRRLDSHPDSALVVEIALPFGGSLRVNPLFKSSLHEANSDKIEEWQADLARAQLLVKCLKQRAGALELLMARLAVLQRGYILGEAPLEPLTRAELAQDLGLHESTISRAVSGKSAQLPNGHIVPLSLFFKRNLSARAALKMLVEQETKPLSDEALAVKLQQMGYPIARRTVAKYRDLENILPAHLRRKQAANAQTRGKV
jgi:RNA polymerase sigma-54 factor